MPQAEDPADWFFGFPQPTEADLPHGADHRVDVVPPLQFVEEPLDVLLISFAPGGVTEMSLVALSLQANPAFVTLHHIFRILMTVVELSLAARLLGMR